VERQRNPTQSPSRAAAISSALRLVCGSRIAAKKKLLMHIRSRMQNLRRLHLLPQKAIYPHDFPWDKATLPGIPKQEPAGHL